MKKVQILVLLSIFVFIGCQQQSNQPQKELSSDVITKEEQAVLTPDEVLKNLQSGNERFASDNLTTYDYSAQVQATAKGQYPEAIILSCLDSRVPVEIIFDKGIGDVFVGRVAGNIEDKNMLGSFEFGTKIAGSKLIVVLGHTNCGAVKGAVDYTAVKEMGMDNLNDLLEGINPAVEGSLKEGEERSSSNKDLVNRAVVKNVEMTMERIREKSEILSKLESEGQIKIVGGVYDLNTGKVTWL